MISVAPIGRGLVTYLTEKAREKYYFERGETPGKWLGSARSTLKLFGDVDRKSLRALTLGFGVDGAKLVKNAGKLKGERRRHFGISCVFNADKTLSVNWAFADADERANIEAAFDRAVQRTLHEFIEPEIARCRLADGTEVPAKVAAAFFPHVTNREGDMHYHGHLAIPSVGLCPDGRTRALVSKRFYEHKLEMGAYFRLALEQECAALGLRFYRPLDAKGQEQSHTCLAGVPKEIARHFSKRRRQIEETLQAKGLASAAASAVASLQTRRGKETVRPRPELFSNWREEAARHNLSLDWTKTVRTEPRHIDAAKEYSRALNKGINNLTAQWSHFQRKDILRETFVAAQGRGGIDPLRVYTYLKHDLEHSPDFVNLGVRNQIQRFTIPEILRLEQKTLHDAEKLRAMEFRPLSEKFVGRAATRERPINPSTATTPAGKLYDALFADKTTYRLDAEQQACVRYATQGPGRLKVIYGDSGTTKTTVTAAIAEAYRDAGWKLHGTALAGVAAKNLAEKTGIESDTLRMTLMRLNPTTAQKAKHHLSQLWRAAHHQPTYKLDRLKLSRKSVLFVDESSMIGTTDFSRITAACAKAQATMILIGDAKQLPAIEQGGVFGSIIERFGGFELTQIKRQEQEEERQRVKQLSRGDAEQVIKAYAREGHVHVADTHARAQEKLIADWAKNGGVSAPQDHAILACTNMEVRQLNDLAQQARLKSGALDPCSSVTVTDETLYRGDRVLFTKKNRKLHLENGDSGTILAVRNNPLSAAVTVQLDGENEAREIPLRTLLKTEYAGLTRGYSSTVHKFQGKSVDHTYCLLSGAMTDREITYVSLSRHRKSVHVYTDENQAGVALTNLAREADRERNKITAKPGLSEEYSPLITQATKSNAKTLASDHKDQAEFTLSLRQED